MIKTYCFCVDSSCLSLLDLVVNCFGHIVHLKKSTLMYLSVHLTWLLCLFLLRLLLNLLPQREQLYSLSPLYALIASIQAFLFIIKFHWALFLLTLSTGHPLFTARHLSPLSSLYAPFTLPDL